MANPTQARSHATEERILATTERLLASTPFEELSVAAIAEEAGVSVGGVYARFDSKTALLVSLHARYEAYRTSYLGEAFAAALWRGTDLEARVRGICAAIVTLMRERRHVLRSFLLRHWSSPRESDEFSREALNDIYERAIELLLTSPRGSIGAPNPKKAARLALAVITGSCRDIIVMKRISTPGAIDARDKELVDALSRAALGILQYGDRRG